VGLCLVSLPREPSCLLDSVLVLSRVACIGIAIQELCQKRALRDGGPGNCKHRPANTRRECTGHA
jgi:hypothetical protein